LSKTNERNVDMKIFVVEDDAWFSKIIEYHLKQNPDHEVHVYDTAKKALKDLYLLPDAMVIDYNLPDYKGDELLKKVQEENKNIPCVIVSAQEDIEIAIDLLKKGAFDYIVKNDNTKDRLWITMNNIKERKTLKNEIVNLQQAVKKKYDFSKLIKGNSSGIQKVFRLIEKASQSNITVSITGETGTGKELAAKAVHFNSNRNKNSFVAVNVAAIPKELIESELFGHEKGAFTGADKRRVGKFEESSKGTIF
jgi:Response regulator containing CheY-like receiver, AAA-type ATPase, and DNA-binding domains